MIKKLGFFFLLMTGTALAQPTILNGYAVGARGDTFTAPSSSYAARVIELIRANIYYAGSYLDQATVVIKVRVDRQGGIIEARVIQPSTKSALDEAVLRGIKRMGSVPRDIDGRIPDRILREGLEVTLTYGTDWHPTSLDATPPQSLPPNSHASANVSIAPDPHKADRDRLAAEAESERRRRQELEQRLASQAEEARRQQQQLQQQLAQEARERERLTAEGR